MTSGGADFWTNFMPHGQCYLWRPDILWLNVVSDAVIALAYFSIPITLFFFLRERPYAPFRNLIFMFSVFILACGVTHVMGIWTVWHGSYGMQGLSKGFTAVVSLGTALMLVPIMPKLIALRSPTELEMLNQKLEDEIAFHKEASAQLKQTEKQFRTFLKLAPDGVLISDSDGGIDYTNNMMQKIFGFSTEEFKHLVVEDLVPKRVMSGHQTHRSSYFEDPDIRPMGKGLELSGRRKDGTEFPTEISLSPIDIDGKRVTLATVRDISERKRLEAETRQQLDELAYFNRLRTAEELASGLAHELNQPIAAISQNCATAISIENKSDSPNADLVELLEDNYQYSQRAGKMIRSMRQLVKKTDGKKAPEDISSLIRATTKLIHSEITAANVQVELTLQDDLPEVMIDIIQVQQVLVNLCRNAIEALSDNVSRLRELHITTTYENKKHITVEVSDNGPGLSDHLKSNLFQPRVTSKDSGMGLGLSISRSIVEAMGGRLWFDEESIDGATFKFTLPIAEDLS